MVPISLGIKARVSSRLQGPTGSVPVASLTYPIFPSPPLPLRSSLRAFWVGIGTDRHAPT